MAIIEQRDAELFQERANPEETIKTKIDLIASTIVRVEENKSRFAGTLSRSKAAFRIPVGLKKEYAINDDALASGLALQNPAGMRIGSVDGSVLRESLVGVDIIASKARGVVFKFYTKKPPIVKYFPQEKNENFNLFGIFQNANAQELESFSNAERLLSELELVHAILSAEPHLDMMIIDGSLFIPEIFTSSESYFASRYNKQISDVLKRILETSRQNGTILVGVVKDSIKADFAGTVGRMIPACIDAFPAFKEFLSFDYRQAIQVFKDYDLFYRFLSEGERSFSMRTYPRPGQAIGTATEFDRYMKDNDLGLYSYMFKAVPMDIPLKVEFFSTNDRAAVASLVDKSSALLYPLSKINVDYSEPSPQMEAHKRVRIPEQDFKVIIDIIRQKTGFCSTMLQKRRERRPF
ncbi:MAG: DNA double-strand break repair nuclease NurA [Candidatus Lokiarchaeota archaeon]|nr:DNA double-strand break repair nuclease NurA [Candidatus Lokiarchaeota archaeon]